MADDAFRETSTDHQMTALVRQGEFAVAREDYGCAIR